MSNSTGTNRWGIAAAGFLMQMALGAVYAWSVFKTPLSKQFHWTGAQVTLTFTLCIVLCGIAAFFGGLLLNVTTPRVVALVGGFLYGLGVFLASFSADKLWWLYLSYGVIGGFGLGLGYIVPVAVLVKWFPDRRGLITGIAVGGFGAGALTTAPLATNLIKSIGVLQTFAWLGIGYLVSMGSLAGYSAFVWLLQVRPATQVSTHAYVNPVVALVLGVWFAGERMSAVQLLGLAVILASVLLINLAKYRKAGKE